MLQRRLDIGFPINQQHRLNQVVSQWHLRRNQRMNGIALRHIGQRTLKFFDLVVNLRIGCTDACHVSQTVHLHFQTARIFNRFSRAFQTPRKQQGKDNRQKRRTDP